MKRHLKALLVLMLIVPCLVIFSACGSPTKMADGTYQLNSIKVSAPGMSITYSVEDMLEGGIWDLMGDSSSECWMCEGTGDCWYCSGTGLNYLEQECSNCEGTGMCADCGGTGIDPDYDSESSMDIFTSLSMTVSGKTITMTVGDDSETLNYTLKKGVVNIEGMDDAEEEMDGLFGEFVVKYSKNKISFNVLMTEEGMTMTLSIIFKKV